MTELDILRDLASRLDWAEIHYMLTVLIYYAEPRLTRDIDLIVGLQTGDADRVIRSQGLAFGASVARREEPAQNTI